MSLVQIHIGLARACVIFSLLIGAYGLWRFFRKAGVGGNFWGILAAGEVLYVVQGVVGGLLFVGGGQPSRVVHFLYGFLMLIVLPGAYAYTRGKDERREALVYGLVGLFLAGVALRAISTA